MRNSDTICAISTPPGIGAIAIIRVSGPEAVKIVSSILATPLDTNSPGRIRKKTIMDGEEILDEALVVFFKGPNSYTGEDLVEIHCHGSPYIQKRLMELLIERGARVAREGEFTMRAFLNGKMDLTQAEALASLIQSHSRMQHAIAMKHMRGEIYLCLKSLREQLINALSWVEVELDFSDQDVEFIPRDKIKEILVECRNVVIRLIQSFRAGNAIREGVPVVIAGRPNAGKSTLLNAIVGEERAIVTPIPGTTRDTIEETFTYGGILYRIIDTAGLRQTEEIVEKIGISRTINALQRALVIIYLYDITSTTLQDIEDDLKIINNYREKDSILIVAGNKIDMGPPPSHLNHIFISAREKLGINHLLEIMHTSFLEKFGTGYDVVITSARHLDCLTRALKSLDEAIEAVEGALSSELLAVHLREVSHHLGEITGEVTTEDILTSIFSQFCIGK